VDANVKHGVNLEKHGVLNVGNLYSMRFRCPKHRQTPPKSKNCVKYDGTQSKISIINKISRIQ
jgi:hypothetical protein